VRVTAFLLAFYIAVLVGIPCNDSDTCADEKKTNTALVISTHDHNQDEADTCSPFCFCTCCNVQINQPSYFHFEFTTLKFKDENALAHVPHVLPISLSIWQPPRLG